MANYDQTIQRYLLGDLPESEQITLEQRYFSDEQLFEQIVQVENELNDKYVRGLLPSATREQFEKHYLAHPKRRERASFAESLATKVGDRRLEVGKPVLTEPWIDRLWVFLRGPKLALAFSIAALSIAILAVWFFYQTRQLRQELVWIESERISREQRERELRQQVTNEQLRAEQLSQE